MAFPRNPSLPTRHRLQRTADTAIAVCVSSDEGGSEHSQIRTLSRSSSREDGPEQPEDSLELLIGRVAAGDRSAFRRLYDQTSRVIFSSVLRIVRSREVAEEVTQESYVLIWQRADRYQASRGAPLAWIAAIARYRAIDRIRADRARGLNNTCPTEELDLSLLSGSNRAGPDGTSRPCDNDGSIADAMSVRKLLTCLKPDHRRAILLAYRYGYTHEELASAMNVPLGTAKSWVRRGLQSMREGLES